MRGPESEIKIDDVAHERRLQADGRADPKSPVIVARWSPSARSNSR
jgi:hypothetical protein